MPLTENQKKIILDLALQKLSLQEFFEKYPLDESQIKDYIHQLYKEAFDEKSDDTLEFSLLLHGFLGLRDWRNGFSSIWRELLKEGWHRQHEDLVVCITGFEDPQDIDLLFQIACTKFDYMIEEDNVALTTRCVYALGSLHHPEAKKRIALIAKLNDYPSVQYAVNRYI
ncbi:MAG: hypothetical protein AAFR66_08690 [Bacteroidota bacterium]